MITIHNNFDGNNWNNMNENGEINRTTNVLGDAWVMKNSSLSADGPLAKTRLPEHFDNYPCSESLQGCLSLNLNKKFPLEMGCLKSCKL